MKTCVRCGATKDLSEFHKRAKSADGLNPACKTCICAARRQYTADNPEKLREARKRYDADPEKRARKLSRIREWREANPERVAEYRERHYRDNLERYRAWKHAWYEANREAVLTWAARNPEANAAKMKRYRERHREERAERERRRQAIYRAAPIDAIDLDALWTGRCGICGQPLDRDLAKPDLMRKSLDHIIPLALGGAHTQDNIQWAHLRCNISKGARLPDQLAEGGERHRHTP